MSLEACAELVSRGDPDRFLAAMAAPPAARARLFPLYAFNLEIARAPWVAQEPMIGQMRLQFWHDVLVQIEAGESGETHEVVAPLREVIRDTGLPLALLHKMIEARLSDIERPDFSDPAALMAYLESTSGNLVWATVVALGGAGDLEAPARAVGRASGLANWLMAAPDLMQRGWQQVLPLELTSMVAEARSDLAEARKARFGPATAAIRACWRADGILTRAARDPAAIHEGRLAGSEMSRRGSLLIKSLTGGW
ncbi:MAG: squalene/phytoene synthase family protein [Maritimibacter sp.]